LQTEKYFYFSDPSDAELSYILSMDRLYIAAATVKRMLLIRCMKRCKAIGPPATKSAQTIREGEGDMASAMFLRFVAKVLIIW